jgi:F-type H+-transporting ATPase subunit epsilon
MSAILSLNIILPEQKLPTYKVRAVDLPACDGRLTIMPNHQPLIAALKNGTMKITTENGKKERWSISSGAVRIHKNIAELLLKTAIKNETNY